MGLIASSVWTPISWTAELFDTDAYFSLGAPTDFTIPVTGVYMISGSARLDPALAIFGTGIRATLNGGAQILAYGAMQGLNPDFWGSTVAALFVAAANDFIRLETIQNRGTPADPNLTFARFSIQRMRTGTP